MDRARDAIITPTYAGHFHFIPSYLRSYETYVSDRAEYPVYFTISREERAAFEALIRPFAGRLDLRVVLLEDLLEEADVPFPAERLLNRYGRFSFQTLKKLYTMLFCGAERFLVLDSESMWIRPTRMRELFEGYFSAPFLSFSPIDPARRDPFLREAVSNIDDLIGCGRERWFLEHFVWFYRRDILEDLVREAGTPIEMAERVHQRTQFRALRPGVLEILLYHGYLYRNRDRYDCRAVDIEEQCRRFLPEEEFGRYVSRFYQYFHGHNGLTEQAMMLLTPENVRPLADLFIANRIQILRCEATTYENYPLQREFIARVRPAILAASQNHLFGLHSAPSYRMRWLLREWKRRIRSGAKRLILRVSPAYKAGMEARELAGRTLALTEDRFLRLEALLREEKAPQTQEDALRRLRSLVERYGNSWFRGRRVLCADGADSPFCGMLLSLGADVTLYAASPERRPRLEERFPGLRILSPDTDVSPVDLLAELEGDLSSRGALARFLPLARGAVISAALCRDEDGRWLVSDAGSLLGLFGADVPNLSPCGPDKFAGILRDTGWKAVPFPDPRDFTQEVHPLWRTPGGGCFVYWICKKREETEADRL